MKKLKLIFFFIILIIACDKKQTKVNSAPEKLFLNKFKMNSKIDTLFGNWGELITEGKESYNSIFINMSKDNLWETTAEIAGKLQYIKKLNIFFTAQTDSVNLKFSVLLGGKLGFWYSFITDEIKVNFYETKAIEYNINLESMVNKISGHLVRKNKIYFIAINIRHTHPNNEGHIILSNLLITGERNQNIIHQDRKYTHFLDKKSKYKSFLSRMSFCL
jgi:hypothetical protein